MAASSGAWRSVIEDEISLKETSLREICQYLWKNPENSFQESGAHQYLTDFLEKEGFSVERGYIAPTGFRASFEVNAVNANGDSEDSANVAGGDASSQRKPHVCFICEYDATAGVGHAAGHNLKSGGSIGSALAIKACLQKNVFGGKVTILGTPGEDCGCGTKITMVQKAVFANIDFCLMVSPFNKHILYPKFYTLLVVGVTYRGKAAHASAFPWEGRNALDAAVACYNNIGLLRQQMKPTWSINGIILTGGIQPNVIPEFTELKFWLRAPDSKDLVIIQQKCTACFVAAAKATGCEAQFHFEETPYYPMEHNTVLGEVFKDQSQMLGIQFSEAYSDLETHIGSTDFGNVSQAVPCLNPVFDIGKQSHIHSVDFHEAVGTSTAVDKTLLSAKVMALTAAVIMTSPSTLESVKASHKEKHGRSTATILQRMRSVSVE